MFINTATTCNTLGPVTRATLRTLVPEHDERRALYSGFYAYDAVDVTRRVHAADRSRACQLQFCLVRSAFPHSFACLFTFPAHTLYASRNLRGVYLRCYCNAADAPETPGAFTVPLGCTVYFLF